MTNPSTGSAIAALHARLRSSRRAAGLEAHAVEEVLRATLKHGTVEVSHICTFRRQQFAVAAAAVTIAVAAAAAVAFCASFCWHDDGQKRHVKIYTHTSFFSGVLLLSWVLAIHVNVHVL